MNGGTDVVVLEARNRPGGRVEQTTLADGRIVQLGGEVIGPFHASYLGLAEELGLTIVPSFPQLPGEDTWVLADGRYIGDFPWTDDTDRASFAALSDEFGALAHSVDPDDPWSHPEADRLDRLSVGDWLRDITGWRPGDVTSVGPLHGTHEPPFYVCGSDQWVCGYMKGAVRTGRGAASAALGTYVR